nr:LysE family transporter [Saprospiraceae bacterium]
MDLVFKGILLGLTLSIMTGPIFITLIQTGMEKGFRAGVTVASGFWTSDILYIAVVSYAISFLMGLAAEDHFEVYISLIGGTILIAFGLGLILFGKVPARGRKYQKPRTGSSYLGFWSLGFFMNTFNPGTVIFWIGITSIISESLQLNIRQSFPFFAGLMGTIIFTDIIKVGLAKKISYYLTPRLMIMVRKIAGIALISFGGMLFLRILYKSLNI